MNNDFINGYFLGFLTGAFAMVLLFGIMGAAGVI